MYFQNLKRTTLNWNNILSIIALVTGTLGVWLTIRQTIWCWPFALISVLTSIISFYEVRLYGDMSLQIFYFFAGVYGWVYWKKKDKEVFIITKMPKRFLYVAILITGIQSVIYYFILINVPVIVYFFEVIFSIASLHQLPPWASNPLFDAILTACSITVTYMMTKKWLENWILWVLIDSAYVVLYGIKFMWLFAILNLFFTIIAFYGWLKWRKEAV